MEPTVDQILDRQHLRRRLTIWRVLAFLAIIIAVIGIFTAVSLPSLKAQGKGTPHVARIAITGFISNNRYALQQIEKIRKNKNVKGVILVIDSPGGTTVGGEAYHNAIRKLAETKPVVVSVGGLAASAGYMIAVASDHIVAPRTSIVGSVGVILQYPNASELLKKLGVTVEEIKSSPLKGEPSPFNETPEEARRMMEVMLLDTYQWFADLVKERRGFNETQAKELLNASVYTGRQAVENKLIDALGDEATAKKWLVDEKKVSKSLKTITWSLKKPRQDFPFASAIWLSGLQAVGLSDVAEAGAELVDNQRLNTVDGFLSIWQVGGQ